MANVALYLGKLSVSEKTQLGRRIVKDMTGNAFFPKPNPSLTQITDAINAVDVAQTEAAGGGKETTFQLNAQVKLLETILSQAAKYVEFVSGGDESKIISAGMSVKPK